MTIWFTSDTHFGHARIIELCDRPFKDVNHMNSVLVDNWNDRVQPGELVFHCGDMVMGSFADNISILSRLNGTIALAPGNHDRVSSAYHHKSPAVREKFALMYEEQGVMILNETNELVLNGRKFTLSHYPYVGDSHDEDRYVELRPENKGDFLIHGHVHTEWKYRGNNMVNVGVDVWDYAPVAAETLGF